VSCQHPCAVRASGKSIRRGPPYRRPASHNRESTRPAQVFARVKERARESEQCWYCSVGRLGIHSWSMALLRHEHIAEGASATSHTDWWIDCAQPAENVVEEVSGSTDLPCCPSSGAGVGKRWQAPAQSRQDAAGILGGRLSVCSVGCVARICMPVSCVGMCADCSRCCVQMGRGQSSCSNL
jgi:hypothetical protein